MQYQELWIKQCPRRALGFWMVHEPPRRLWRGAVRLWAWARWRTKEGGVGGREGLGVLGGYAARWVGGTGEGLGRRDCQQGQEKSQGVIHLAVLVVLLVVAVGGDRTKAEAVWVRGRMWV